VPSAVSPEDPSGIPKDPSVLAAILDAFLEYAAQAGSADPSDRRVQDVRATYRKSVVPGSVSELCFCLSVGARESTVESPVK